jgi:hypothetical protein
MIGNTLLKIPPMAVTCPAFAASGASSTDSEARIETVSNGREQQD